jgi:hypothetical protein
MDDVFIGLITAFENSSDKGVEDEKFTSHYPNNKILTIVRRISDLRNGTSYEPAS